MTRQTVPISAFIICKNEVSVLGACLESLDICQEIVVVDSGSTDGTLELIESYRARGLPLRLIRQEWLGFARQKQFALEQCTSAWCLNLDSDERLDDKLKAQLLALDLDQPGVAGYAIRRPEYLPGYGYPPSAVHARYHVRVVRKSSARYDTNLVVHESLLVDGEVRKLPRGRILHFRNLSIQEDCSKMNGYSRLKAFEGHKRGKTSGLSKIMLKPVAQFLKFYLGQRYFLCGTPGFIYSIMLSSYVFMTEAKLYRLSRNGMPSE
jgi:glycosyltransferase involved in cell wall biosynthesis